MDIPRVKAEAASDKSKGEISQADGVPGTATINVISENGITKTYTVE
jgi:hypothetical protein